jgi:putative two-component system response regulator
VRATPTNDQNVALAMTHKIIIVDDEPANVRLLERLFRRDYQVLTAESGAEALRLLEQHDAALLITDQRMPGMTGIELLKLTADFRPHMVRIILTGYTDIGALVEAINCGHVYKYVTKPWNNDELRLTVGRAVEHYETNKARHELELTNQRLSARLRAMTRAVVRSISDALEARDEHVYGHARRVSGYAVAVGRALRLPVAALEQLSLAALLHDIGKIATPDRVLLKPTSLDEREQSLMRLHAERGARILAGVPEMEEVAGIVRHHHENWDGTGYPEGLAGEFIPLASRIIRAADAYDAMTSPRPFREAYGHAAAVARLREGAVKQFDPAVVGAFGSLDALAKIRNGVAAWAGGDESLPLQSPIEPAHATFNDLVGYATREPGFALCVLREANRSQGGARTASIAEACSLLGESCVRRLATRGPVYAPAAGRNRQFREHSQRAAVAARLLAELTGAVEPGEAYTAGLLHDIGEALLSSLFPEEMERFTWLETEAQLEREVAAFGVDHAQVGQWLLEACGLPRHLGAAVQAHHDAVRINSPAALLLHVADRIARAESPSEVTPLDALGSDRLAMLGLNRSDLARIHERTAKAAKERRPVTT